MQRVLQTVTLTSLHVVRAHDHLNIANIMHQSIPAAPMPRRATEGHFSTLLVPGWGISKFCAA